MDRSQSLNALPYFDGSNYNFWKVWMRAFLCSIDESVWDAVDVGWINYAFVLVQFFYGSTNFFWVVYTASTLLLGFYFFR